MSALALSIGAALALAGAGDAPADPTLAAIGGDAEIIRTQTDRDRRMTVPVRIGEGEPYHFVIDTGSQTTVLAHDIAERMALRPGRRARVVGIGEHLRTSKEKKGVLRSPFFVLAIAATT